MADSRVVITCGKWRTGSGGGGIEGERIPEEGEGAGLLACEEALPADEGRAEPIGRGEGVESATLCPLAVSVAAATAAVLPSPDPKPEQHLGWKVGVPFQTCPNVERSRGVAYPGSRGQRMGMIMVWGVFYVQQDGLLPLQLASTCVIVRMLPRLGCQYTGPNIAQVGGFHGLK